MKALSYSDFQAKKYANHRTQIAYQIWACKRIKKIQIKSISIKQSPQLNFKL